MIIGVAHEAGGHIRGTAFAIGTGIVMTAAHVVRGHPRVWLRSPGTDVPARVIAVDERLDAALLGTTDGSALPIPVIREATVADATMRFTATGWPIARPFARDPLAIGRVVDPAATIFGGVPAVQLYSDELAMGLDPHGMSGSPVSMASGAGVSAVVGFIRWGPLDPERRSRAGIVFATPIAIALSALGEQVPADERLRLFSWRARSIAVRGHQIDLTVAQPATIFTRSHDDPTQSPWTDHSVSERRSTADALDPEVFHDRTLIVGAAGVGKSTLAARVLASVPGYQAVISSARNSSEVPHPPADRLMVDGIDRWDESDLTLVGQHPSWTVTARRLADVPLELRRAASHVVHLRHFTDTESRATLAGWMGIDTAADLLANVGIGPEDPLPPLLLLPMYLRLVAQAAPRQTTLRSARELLQVVAEGLLQSERSDRTRTPTGTAGVLADLESLAFRLLNQSPPDGAAGPGMPQLPPGLQPAVEVGIVWDSPPSFSHDLWLCYFASRQVERAIAAKRTCAEFFGRTPWWKASPWMEPLGLAGTTAGSELLGEWLADCRPLDAAHMSAGLLDEPEFVDTCVRLAAEGVHRPSDPLHAVRSVELLDLVTGGRPGTATRDDGSPDIAWTPPMGTVQLATFPVTFAQWRAFRPEGDDEAHVHPHPSTPAVYVSWHDAVEFCRWLSERWDEEIRLPTAAEWESFATGADRTDPYPFGGWRSGSANTRALKLGEPSPVGAFPTGVAPSGAHDLVGNVWEWCGDSGADGMAAVKGGSFASYTHHATIRTQTKLRVGTRHDDVGFRILRVLTDDPAR
jgi:hypothetical protein